MSIKARRAAKKTAKQAENERKAIEYHEQVNNWMNYLAVKYHGVPTKCLEHRRNIIALQDFTIPSVISVATFIPVFVLAYSLVDEKVFWICIALCTFIAFIAAMFTGMITTFILSRKERSREYDELIEEIGWRERQDGEKVDWKIRLSKPCMVNKERPSQ